MCFRLACCRGLSTCLTAVACIALLVICAGPILIVVGIVLITADGGNSDRNDRVDEFNRAVEDYRPTRVAGWRPGTTNGAAMMLYVDNVVVYGDTDRVTDVAKTEYLGANGPYSSTASFSLNGIAPFTRTGIRQSGTRAIGAYCGSSFGCSNYEMNNYCRSAYGGGAYFTSGGYCNSKGDCGQCFFSAYLTEVCAVIDPITNQPATNMQSCFYPFRSGSDQSYGSRVQPGSIRYTVRQSDDPFIALQRLTEGSESFGTPDNGARNWGIALLIVGCIITAIALIAIIVLCCKKRQMQKQQGAADGASGPDTFAATAAATNNAPDFEPPIPPPQQQQPAGPYYPSNATAHPLGAPPYYQNQPMPPPQPQPFVPPTVTPYGYGAQQQQQIPNAAANAFAQPPLAPEMAAPLSARPEERPYFYPGPSNAVEGVVMQTGDGPLDQPNPYGAGNCTYV